MSEYKKFLFDRATHEVILFHGTPFASQILEEGLKGGFNNFGGTHGRWDHPILFMSYKPNVAQKYGKVLTIRMDLDTFIHQTEYIADGVGDGCACMEGNGILVPFNKISFYDEEEDYEKESINLYSWLKKHNKLN